MVSWKTPFSPKMSLSSDRNHHHHHHHHHHQDHYHVIILLPLILTFIMGGYEVSSSSCPAECMCRWKGGKESVECTSRGLTSIPTDIAIGTQVLDLSGNNIQSLAKDTFLGAELLNLQKIYLSNCNLGHIEEGAFARLNNLIELDLSHNLLVNVPIVTLKDVINLRRLSLSDNPIQRIENNAFASVAASLNSLELSRCHLEVIAPRAFHGLKGLNQLKLDNNHLTTLSGKTIQPLKNLHSVDLHGNPWRCDCSMQDVKQWVAHSNPPPTCAQPERVSGMTLDQLDISDLACEPRGLHLNRHLFQAIVGKNASLACQVTGNPSPNISWLRNGIVLTNLSRFNHEIQMYVMTERGNTEKTSILTMTSVTERDAGNYECVASNKAGQFSANYSLIISYRDSEASGLTSGQIAGISVGLVLVGAIVLLLICILLAKWRQLDREIIVKHPPLVMNSVNHVNHNDYNHEKFNHRPSKSDGGTGNFRMPFSIARLSNSTHGRTYGGGEDDGAASEDSDRTLIDTNPSNCDSPLKSSNCTLSTNKPDVVNVVRKNSESGRSKKIKDGRSRKKDKDKNKNKEKRKDSLKWKTEEMDDAYESQSTTLTTTTTKDVPSSKDAKEDVDNRFNLVAAGVARQSCPQYQQNLHKTLTTTLSRSQSKEMNTIDGGTTKKGSSSTAIGVVDVLCDDERYGSYGNLKLSSSSEWNKVCAAAETIENAAFDGDVTGLARESYELLEKTWGRGGLLTHNNGSCVDNANPNANANATTDAISAKTGSSTGSKIMADHDGATCVGNASRFRHYVPVLPPFPAQHYSQVRNSLIRTNEDITDM